MKQDKSKIAMLIKLEKREGEKLAEQHPEIADLYKGPPEDPNQGLTYEELAGRFIPESNESIGAGIVKYAMRCLLSREELLEYKNIHKARRFSHEARSKGAANQSLESKSAAGHEGARKRGCILWKIGELSDVLNRMGNPDYQTYRGSDNTRISEELNQKHHGGKEVRNNKSVGKMVSKIRDNKEWYLHKVNNS